MGSNKKVKSMSFSKADKYEMQLLAHAEAHNQFAPYIKRLIQRDMENGVKVNINIEDKETIERLEKRISELEAALAQMSKIIDEVR
ncbi:hypothetical protein SAMN04488168_1466 [Bacillus sp. 491mf]|uniref:hypothetical protein n=1 Tax=Bacillus sp. 491mf TaxID=1761755 RepID=UPI0008E37E5D|nr:hypothetical protein [Bacillus sp. 491mf]SFD50268.1 hypothetical protein SAMN04488168_1466 [Bacillus sp. 491mf]